MQKYLSLTGHVYTPAYVTVNTKNFAKLPADVQQILTETAQETQAYVYEQAAQLETSLLAELKAGGMIVNTADKDAFIKARFAAASRALSRRLFVSIGCIQT